MPAHADLVAHNAQISKKNQRLSANVYLVGVDETRPAAHIALLARIKRQIGIGLSPGKRINS